MSKKMLKPYIPADADRAEEYALKFQMMVQCATVSVKGSHDETEFSKFRELVAEFPNVPIVYFLPVWRSDKDRITRGRTLEEVIPLLRKEAERWPQITVVDCWDFIPHEEGYFFDARLHPNDEGAACQAEGVYRAIARRLGIDV